MTHAARPCHLRARAGSLRLGLAMVLLLSGCDINTDNLTPRNIGAGIVRSMCRAQNNCDVHDAP